MSLHHLNAAPLNIDPALPGRIRERLDVIMAPGPALADECALLDLVETVADALHMGTLSVHSHDALVDEINDARMTLT